MKVLAIYDRSGPKYHRVLLPLMHMNRVEYEITDTITPENIKGKDILFFNRAISKISLRLLLEAKQEYGFKMICDIDDHWRLDPSHLLYEQYQDHNLTNIIAAYIRESDAVIVTHERLYNDALALNKNVHIVPNAIPKAGQFLFQKQPDEKIRLFWAGSVTHRKDLEILRNPAKRINCDKVKWVMGGYDDREPHVKKEWDAIASVFKGNDFDCELIRQQPVESYYSCYSKCDISMVPLIDNSFNCYKSNLKILETANIASPVIVNRVNPYLGFPEHLVNYVSKQPDWYLHANNLIRNPVFIKEQGLQLQDYCNTVYNFERINEHRRQILEYEAGKH